MLIASIGLFGLMSYSVARRTNEIGIRMALGAQPQAVRRMVLGESMTLVVVGVILGVAIALAAGRLVAALLFGIAATDVTTIALGDDGDAERRRPGRLSARPPRLTRRPDGGAARGIAEGESGDLVTL